MPINQFVPFAASSTANVMSQADYEAMSSRASGFVAGVAKSAEINKVLRQSAAMSSMIGGFIAKNSGGDAIDDGDISQLNELFEAAVWGGRFLKAGSPLPTKNIGPIWHDDYNSLMTWQVFSANGANYTGYASVLVGGLLLDTQPTPRKGYVRSGVQNLSRTAYAALRGWAMHNGIMVAQGVWAAGTIAVCDNADGTTFRAYDVRGEFLRAWDDGRGVDAGRVFGGRQTDDFLSHSHDAYTLSIAATVGSGTTIVYPTGAKVEPMGLLNTGGTETRPRNVALLSSIKF